MIWYWIWYWYVMIMVKWKYIDWLTELNWFITFIYPLINQLVEHVCFLFLCSFSFYPSAMLLWMIWQMMFLWSEYPTHTCIELLFVSDSAGPFSTCQQRKHQMLLSQLWLKRLVGQRTEEIISNRDISRWLLWESDGFDFFISYLSRTESDVDST